MSTADESKWIRLVAQLLDVAEDTRCSEGEREMHRYRAFTIMARRNIDEALVRGFDAKAAASDPFTTESVELPPPFSDVQALHFGLVAETLGCKSVINRERVTYSRWNDRSQSFGQYTISKGPAVLRLFGRRSVVQRAAQLVRSLNIQCVYALAQTHGVAGVDRAYRRAFVIGFGHTCRERMTAIMGEQKAAMTPADASRYALVLASDADLLDAFVARECPDMFEIRQAYSSRAGLRAGAEEGRNADIGQARVGTDRVALGTKAHLV